VKCATPVTGPQISLHKIPEGYPGTLETIGHIKELVRNGAKDFGVRQTAIDILIENGIKPKDYLGEIRALFEWVQKNIRYTRDTYRVELLHSARRMLELRAGDCDDMAILLAALLEAIGHPVRLVLTGPDPLRRNLFTHIYVEVFHERRWIPLDATMPYAIGWAPRAPVRKVFTIDRNPIMTPENMELRGIGAAEPAPEWLRSLIRAVRSEAMQPKDGRVRSLWDVLRRRELLRRDPWVAAVLRRVWNQGLPVRERPRTTERLVAQLRLWNILPGPVYPIRLRPLRPVALRPLPPRPYGPR